MKYILFPILAVAILAFAACSDNEENCVGVAYETITLKNGIYNSTSTRTINQQLQEYKFDEGRPVGVFVSGIATEYGYGYSNVKLVTDGIEGFTGPTLYYPTEGSIVVCSYAPYNEDFSLYVPQMFSVMTDQRSEEDYINSDLLYAEASADKYDATVTLKYFHQLEKIDINIHGDIEEVLGDTLTLLNLRSSAMFLPSSGEITSVNGSETDIVTATYNKIDDDDEYLTSSTIVVPQDVSKLTITIGEYTYTCTTNVDLEGGERYSFNCTVEKGKYAGSLNYEGTINNWEDGVIDDEVIDNDDDNDGDDNGDDNEDVGEDDYLFPLSSLDPTIWGDGSFNSATNTLITDTYGFGGWHFSPALDLSGYNYLVVKTSAGTDFSGGVRFRLFDEDNYWSMPANFLITDYTTVIDLNNQAVDDTDNEGYMPIDPSHIYIAGFWTYGGSDFKVVIDKVYATNTYPNN